MSARACIPVTHARLTPALARAHTLTHALAQVMKQDMELRNIQQIEERKYQVEIMRLKTEVEELKREQKKKQQVSFCTVSSCVMRCARPVAAERDRILPSSRSQGKRLAARDLLCVAGGFTD